MIRRLGILAVLACAACGAHPAADCAVTVGEDGQLNANVGISWTVPAGAVSFHVEGEPSDAALTINLQRADASVITSYVVAALPSDELPVEPDTFAVQVYNTGAAPLLSHRLIFDRCP